LVRQRVVGRLWRRVVSCWGFGSGLRGSVSLAGRWRVAGRAGLARLGSGFVIAGRIGLGRGRGAASGSNAGCGSLAASDSSAAGASDSASASAGARSPAGEGGIRLLLLQHAPESDGETADQRAERAGEPGDRAGDQADELAVEDVA